MLVQYSNGDNESVMLVGETLVQLGIWTVVTGTSCDLSYFPMMVVQGLDSLIFFQNAVRINHGTRDLNLNLLQMALSFSSFTLSGCQNSCTFVICSYFWDVVFFCTN